MLTKVDILDYIAERKFNPVRTTEINGEPWLVGKDVAEILGYSNPNEALSEHIDQEDKLNSKTLSSFELNLGQRGGWLINESGLYSLVLSSKLPSAKKFKRWVKIGHFGHPKKGTVHSKRNKRRKLWIDVLRM